MRYVTLIFLVCVSFACASAPDPVPCVPTIETQDKLTPAPCIITIEAVEGASLPDYPAFDEADPAGWAKEVRRIYKLREMAKDDEIKALRGQIAHHNTLEPKCSD